MIKTNTENGYLIQIPKSFHGYRCIRNIGHGLTCIAELVEDQNTGKRYCAKISSITDIKNKNLTKLIEKEIAILDVVDHPNIIKMKEYFEIQNKYEERFVVIILEYCENGDLISYAYSHKSMTDVKKKKIFIGFLKSIQYLHSLGISHGDIKAENILLTKRCNAKLCDFGFCRTTFVAGDDAKYGTLFYAAPELYYKGDFDPFKTDIYAIGMTLYSIFELKFPIEEGDQNFIINQTIKGKLSLDPLMNKQFKDLIVRCLDMNPKKRPTIDEILNHPFFDLDEKKHLFKDNNYNEKNMQKENLKTSKPNSFSSSSSKEKYDSPVIESYDSILKI